MFTTAILVSSVTLLYGIYKYMTNYNIELNHTNGEIPAKLDHTNENVKTLLEFDPDFYDVFNDFHIPNLEIHAFRTGQIHAKNMMEYYPDHLDALKTVEAYGMINESMPHIVTDWLEVLCLDQGIYSYFAFWTGYLSCFYNSNFDKGNTIWNMDEFQIATILMLFWDVEEAFKIAKEMDDSDQVKKIIKNKSGIDEIDEIKIDWINYHRLTVFESNTDSIIELELFNKVFEYGVHSFELDDETIIIESHSINNNIK
jgi:hypothetical protein